MAALKSLGKSSSKSAPVVKAKTPPAQTTANNSPGLKGKRTNSMKGK